MKKNFFKKIVAGAVAMSLTLASCGGSKLDQGAQPTDKDEPVVATDAPKDVVEVDYDSLEQSKLVVSIATGNTQRTIVYNQSEPLTLPSGEVVTAGDLKPVWQYISDRLNVEIVDNTIQDQSAAEMIDLAAATGFKDANIYGGNTIAEKLMSYGAQGYFVDLTEHMDLMPNYKAYLDANESIKQSITAYDGGIYHVPYIAEIDNYSRAFNLREGFVTAVLDNETLEEKATISVAYTPYWVDENVSGLKLNWEGKNVVELQNEKAVNGVLSQKDAREVLIQYINDNYDYANPSELYVGIDAKYNMDELVALLRVIKLSPDTLTKQATGNIVSDAIITPFFVRQSKYREDTMYFVNYFGGQRVFGADTYSAKFYINDDDQLEFSYAQDDFLAGIEKIEQMYREGLISKEFSDVNNKANFRTDLFGKDDVEGHKQFGFMTFDWIPSTTATSDKVTVVLPPVTTLNGGTEFVHYVENTRTVKPDGWAISANTKGEELERALILFDYFFTEEGNIIQNYGTPDMIIENETFVGPDGISYPKINDWFVEQAGIYKNGDVAAFLRDFIGATIPIGYAKEIGFEYQYTTENGFAGWELYGDANVLSKSYGATDNFFKLSPSFFSFTDQDLSKLTNANIGEVQTDAIFMFITGQGVKSVKEIKDNYISNNIELYVQTYNDAYNRTK